MAFESVRSYVQLASGLGEMTMARAMEAAQGLLALPGADEVTRRAVQVSTLADQLLDAAKSNRANLVALVQAEVEVALKRADVARVADVEAARAALAGVSKELADLRSTLLATGTSAVAGATRGSLGRARSGAVSTTAPRTATPQATTEPPAAAPVKKAAPRTTTTTKKATATKPAPRKTAAAKKTTATKTTGKKTTATKTTGKKTTATKPAPRKTAAATKAGAKKTTAKKTTATKTTARKSTAKKATP